MGLIKKAVGFVALQTAAQVVDHKLKKDYSKGALMGKTPFNKSLTLDGHYSKHGGSFTVFSKDTAKYRVKSTCWFHERSAIIYDMKNNELGEVTLHTGIHSSCSMVLAGKDIGCVKVKKLVPPQKFEISLDGWGGSWHIEGDLPGWRYNVFDDDNVVYTITHGYTSKDDNDSILGLSYSSVSNELIGLLFMLAISLFNSIGIESK